MIVEAVAGEDFEVQQLLSDSDEPHHYSMRISDKLLLNRADLVVWTGPELEAFLRNSISDLNPEGVITTSTLPDIRVSPDEASNDPHIWLNPRNAIIMATEISNWLVAHFPALHGSIRSNLKQFTEQTQRKTSIIKERLLPFQNAQLVVDHDAFQHFFVFFGLRQAGSLKSSSGLPQGANALLNLINSGNFDCIIKEPRSRHSRIENIASKLAAEIATIDPLGGDIPHSPVVNDGTNDYVALLENIATRIEQCVSNLAQ
jgi:zinc transport system substrate-binding protein